MAQCLHATRHRLHDSATLENSVGAVPTCYAAVQLGIRVLIYAPRLNGLTQLSAKVVCGKLGQAVFTSAVFYAKYASFSGGF